MYGTSEEYKNLIYDSKHELKMYADDTEIEDRAILSFEKKIELLSDNKMCFGSTPIQTVEAEVLEDSLPNNFEQIYTEGGILDGEIIPTGYFEVSETEEDDTKLKLTLQDRMSKFDFNYDASDLIENEGGSATLLQVAQDICDQAGVELGSTSFLNCDKEISVYDNTIKARTYLGYIAESAGGFAFVAGDGKLYIKTYGTTKYSHTKEGSLINYTASIYGTASITKLYINSRKRRYRHNNRLRRKYKRSSEFI